MGDGGVEEHCWVGWEREGKEGGELGWGVRGGGDGLDRLD